MIKNMRNARRWRGLLLSSACLLAWVGMPGVGGGRSGVAFAQEVEIENDARLEGYGEKVILDGGNTAMTWAGFSALAIVALLGLFKDAKRSHLD
jgi:hypothetical protein